MSLLESIRAGRALRNVGGIQNDASAPAVTATLEISDKYDALVLQANIENWAALLERGGFTPQTLLVPITLVQGALLLRAYERLERADCAEAVHAAAEGYIMTGTTSAALVPEEAELLEELGPAIQKAIDKLGEGGGEGKGKGQGKGCFMKLSSRSPKDAAARSGVFEEYYARAVRNAEPDLDEQRKLWILCQAEGAALRFADAASVIRALVLSERVWQDMTLAFRHRETWQQNVILRKWEAVPIDMEFRTFIANGRLTSISQYAYQLFSPRLNDAVQLKLAIAAIQTMFASLWPILAKAGFTNCVLDFGVIPPKEAGGSWGATLIEINPFEETTDGALFSWTRERDVIEGTDAGMAYPVVRINEKKRTGALAMIPRGWKEVIARVESQLHLDG
ncbi:hypothetical protein C8R43DRAFT_1024710 [Mycena crocata]|nr:hypothetical protein C8R43DRAFT_1024710 [Mycena crocata]